MAGSIGQYGIVVKNKDAGCLIMIGQRLSIKNSAIAVAKHKISGDNKVKLDLAIKNKRNLTMIFYISILGRRIIQLRRELIKQRKKSLKHLTMGL